MKAVQRRRQILEAAREVFGERGYFGCRVEDIIGKAGVARGTFYLYFTSKRGVFEAILDELFERLRACIADVNPRDRRRTPCKQLHSNVERVLDVLLDEPDLTRILLSGAVGLDEDFDTKLDAFYASLLGLLEQSLRTGQRLEMVRPGVDAAVAARCTLGALKELLYRVVVAGDSIGRERLASGLLDVCLRGIWLASS